MKKRIGYIFVVLGFTGIFVNCSAARSIRSSQISKQETLKPEAVASRKYHDVQNVIEKKLESIRINNAKTGSLKFGLIKGFYQLPQVFPAGAVLIREGRVFGQPYRDFYLENLPSKSYAIIPMSPRQSDVLSGAVAQLLDVGVKFVDVSMADTIKIMEAEELALTKKKAFFPGKLVRSGADLLISIQKGYGQLGPVYVGRVIHTKNGQLLALANEIDVGAASLGKLIIRLVDDALRHML